MNIRPHPKKPKCFIIKFWHDCKHYKKTVFATSQREAEQFAYRMRAEVAEGIWKPKKERAKDLLMTDATTKFIDDFSRGRKKSWKNDLTYMDRVNQFFRGKMLSQITAQDVERFRTWLSGQAFKGKTIGDIGSNRHLQFGKAVVNRMILWKLYAGDNPFKGVKLADETQYQRDRHLSREEYERLLAVAHPSLRPILITGAHTGLRPDDMRTLTKGQVNLRSCSLHLPDPKSGKREWVPMNSSVYDAISPLVKNLKDDTEKVFDFTNLPKRWYEARSAAKLKDCRFYDATRHTAGSWITMTTGNLAATQRMLRHRDPKTTMRYAHWAEPVLRQVAAKLDQALPALGITPGSNSPVVVSMVHAQERPVNVNGGGNGKARR